MKENLLMKYSEQLATEIESLCKNLNGSKDCSNMIFQIRKSSSSVFAKYFFKCPKSIIDLKYKAS